MQDTAVMLHCSNPGCQAANPLDGKFCHQCRTPLVKRYLWAVGKGMDVYPKGTLASDRYLIVASQIVLDTKPALAPQILEDIPPSIFTYLKLFPYRPHIPQVYGQLVRGKDNRTGIWLLEYGSLPAAVRQQFEEGQFFPDLATAWTKASPLRQLNWLWQMAQLWQPLLNQNAASSLLEPELLRANGSIFLLRELKTDAAEEPNLKQLGSLWFHWTAAAAPTIQPFLQKLCEQLRSGQIDRAEVLIAFLDRALDESGKECDRRFQICTRTDTGPSRTHNEDACYPIPGSLVSARESDYPLAIVCDGIGGHEGGEIASRIAIDLVRDKLAHVQNSTKPVRPLSLVDTIEEAVCEANDAISDRNDLEHRLERQRMGTTLVLTLARDRQIYLAHVGDSRIYLISRSGCYQMTLDDDWASWEVRLGYTLYRDAVQHYNAGALLQALGMSSSSRLRPTVNRMTLDEDCLFLLCSDGLSDFERVEQYWESEILPAIGEERPLERVVERLIEIANRQNGHDNATVALVGCQVRPREQNGDRPIALPQAQEAIAIGHSTQPPEEAISAGITKRVAAPAAAPRASNIRRFALACTILLLLGLGLGGLSYWLFPEVRSRLKTLGGQAESNGESVPTASDSPSALAPSASDPDVGEIIELQQAVVLYAKPSLAAETETSQLLPPSSRLKVARKQVDAEQNAWLQVQVCPPAAPASPSPQPQPPIEEGWVRADQSAIASATRLTEAASCEPRSLPSPPSPPASPQSQIGQPKSQTE